jgi:hypothetical protein
VNEVYGKCMFELCCPSFPCAVFPFFNHGAVRVLSFRLPSSDFLVFFLFMKILRSCCRFPGACACTFNLSSGSATAECQDRDWVHRCSLIRSFNHSSNHQ